MPIEIKLTQGKFALIDDDDWGLVHPHKWYADHQGSRWYAATKVRREDGKWHVLYMHRLLLGLTDSKVYTDHKDGNGLNNARSNLRACSSGENQRNRGAQANNTSGYKGVYFNRQVRKWEALICLDNKQRSLGRYPTKEEAYVVYCQAAKEMHGEFANVG